MGENTGLYLTAMVGVVAVVAVVLLTMSANSGKQAGFSLGDLAITEDLSGQAAWGARGSTKFGGIIPSNPGGGQYCGSARCNGVVYTCYYDQTGSCKREGSTYGCNCAGISSGGGDDDDSGDDDGDDDDGDDDDDEFSLRNVRYR